MSGRAQIYSQFSFKSFEKVFTIQNHHFGFRAKYSTIKQVNRVLNHINYFNKKTILFNFANKYKKAV